MAVTSVSNMENNQIIDMQFITSRATYEMYWKIKLTYYFYWKLFKNALELSISSIGIFFLYKLFRFYIRRSLNTI